MCLHVSFYLRKVEDGPGMSCIFFFLCKDLSSLMGQTKWTVKQFPVSDLAKRCWWSACTSGPEIQ